MADDEIGCFPELTATLPGLTTAHGDIDLVYARQHATYGAWTAVATMCDYTGDLKALLEQPFRTVDANGHVCFCGYIDQAYRCCGDYMAWGWDSREIINRLAIAYSVGGEARRTAWAEDAASIHVYRQREAVLELPANTLWPTPELYRDRILAEFSQPRAVLHNTYKCDCGRTYLRISGAWRSLAWQSYEEACGLFQAAPNAGERRAFGIGFTSNEIGFHGAYIGSTGHQFDAFDTDELIVISGAGDPNNNIITTIVGQVGAEIRYTSPGIFFDPADDVHDGHGGMSQFVPNQMVCFAAPVVLNAGCYFVDRVLSDGSRFEVHSGGIVSENLVGMPVTINAGMSIRIPDNIDEEMPGATVTIKAYAQIVCQAICNDCDETATVNRVRVKLRKIGSPTDDVRLTLAASCSAVGESGIVVGTDVGSAFDWFQIDVPFGLSLVPGACGYVRIERTGAPSTTDYFELAGHSDSPLVRAQISPDGVHWRAAGYAVAVEGLVTMALGALALQMMQRWADAGSVAVDVAITDITVGGAPFRVPIYRDGGRSLLYEIEQLLALGDPEEGRLRLSIDCNNNVRIDKEPSVDDACTVVDCNGYPAAAICSVRAGQWICAPDGTNDVEPVYLEWIEMKVGSKECRVRYVDRQFLLSDLGYILHYAGAR